MSEAFECQPHDYTQETNLHTGVVEDEDEVGGDAEQFYAAIGEEEGYDDECEEVYVSSQKVETDFFVAPNHPRTDETRN